MSRLGLVAAALLATLAGCAARGPQLATVSEVDLERFMGDWYVIAHIPAFVERNAFNAIESYKLDGDRIETTFNFRNKSFMLVFPGIVPFPRFRAFKQQQGEHAIPASEGVLELPQLHVLPLLGAPDRRGTLHAIEALHYAGVGSQGASERLLRGI